MLNFNRLPRNAQFLLVMSFYAKIYHVFLKEQRPRKTLNKGHTNEHSTICRRDLKLIYI